MGELSPAERRLRASIAGNTRWSKEADPSAATRKARETFLNSFELAVDPDGVLEPTERARRAESARKAHFARLALKSAQARRQNRKAS